MRLRPGLILGKRLPWVALLLGLVLVGFLARHAARQSQTAIVVRFTGITTNSTRVLAACCISNQASFGVHLYGMFMLERPDSEPLLGLRSTPTNLPPGGFVQVAFPVPPYFDSDWRLSTPWSRANAWRLATQVERVTDPRTNLGFLCEYWYSRSDWVRSDNRPR